MLSSQDAEARRRGFAHAYHEAVLNTVLERARGYVHKSKRDIAPAVDRGSMGDRIRAQIAANAQRRFEIAQAMKAEAGVRDHQLTGERNGGVAWSDRAEILAPAGENRVQLATLAHECGHIFLHSVGTEGCYLPGHVKEMEAESYAHQAFAAHGMRMPKQVTRWGRAYVGQWVASDRAAGVPIDPRAEAYASGRRSPYAPLRAVPLSWRLSQSELLRLPEMTTEDRRSFDLAKARFPILHANWWRAKALKLLARMHRLAPVDQWLRSADVALTPTNVLKRPAGVRRELLLALCNAVELIKPMPRDLWLGALGGYAGVLILHKSRTAEPPHFHEYPAMMTTALAVALSWMCVRTAMRARLRIVEPNPGSMLADVIGACLTLVEMRREIAVAVTAAALLALSATPADALARCDVAPEPSVVRQDAL